MNGLKQKGITLIALVVTIVVLLILAGVSINLLLGDNGIITRAKGAKDDYSKSAVKEKISLLLSEYTIDKEIGENKDLAKFLRQNLQVGVAEKEDGSYSFMLGDWQVVTSEREIISIEKFKLDINKTYSSVTDMKNDTSLVAGKIVKTEGYYNKDLGGGAYYDIVSTTSLNADNATCIKLDNGLYAKLHVINDTVSVNQFGAYGDGVHDDANAINNAIKSDYTNIRLEGERYKINRTIEVQNSNKFIIGNNTIIIYDDDFKFFDDYIIRIYKSNTEHIENVYLSGISLVNNNTTKNDETLMLKIMWAENIDIVNCKLESTSVSENKERRVTNIDLRGYWKNINIDNCDLINTTLGPAGGTIWIRAGEEGTGNLNFANNRIKKSCHDETIAAFGKGVIDNINIENNIIEMDDTDVDSKYNPVMNFGLECNRLTNVKFVGNTLDIKSGGTFFGLFGVDNMEISNNNMKLTSIYDESHMTQWFATTDKSKNIVIQNNYIEANKKDDSLSNEIFDGVKKIIGNKIAINVKCAFIARNCENFSDNIIYVNGNQGKYHSTISIYNNIYDKIQVNNNKLTFAVEQSNSARFLNLYKTALNNTRIEVTNNEIKGVSNQSETDKFYVYFQGMKDTENKKIYCKNNNFGFYKRIGISDNSTNYDVIEEW